MEKRGWKKSWGGAQVSQSQLSLQKGLIREEPEAPRLRGLLVRLRERQRADLGGPRGPPVRLRALPSRCQRPWASDGGWEGGCDGGREGEQSLCGDAGRGKTSLPMAWARQGMWAACSQPPTLSMRAEQSPCV